jgi:hypothetical protein
VDSAEQWDRSSSTANTPSNDDNRRRTACSVWHWRISKLAQDSKFALCDGAEWAIVQVEQPTSSRRPPRQITRSSRAAIEPTASRDAYLVYKFVIHSNVRSISSRPQQSQKSFLVGWGGAAGARRARQCSWRHADNACDCEESPWVLGPGAGSVSREREHGARSTEHGMERDKTRYMVLVHHSGRGSARARHGGWCQDDGPLEIQWTRMHPLLR